MILSILTFAFSTIGPTPSWASWGLGFAKDPPVEECAILPPVSRSDDYSSEVIRLINVERYKVELGPIKEHQVLKTMANTRSEEIAEKFSHMRPNGESVGSIFAENGLFYRHAGENLGYGYSKPADLVDAWMASPSHRKNILDDEFVFAELGYFEASDGSVYCSLLFFLPKTI